MNRNKTRHLVFFKGMSRKVYVYNGCKPNKYGWLNCETLKFAAHVDGYFTLRWVLIPCIRHHFLWRQSVQTFEISGALLVKALKFQKPKAKGIMCFYYEPHNWFHFPSIYKIIRVHQKTTSKQLSNVSHLIIYFEHRLGDVIPLLPSCIR